MIENFLLYLRSIKQLIKMKTKSIKVEIEVYKKLKKLQQIENEKSAKYVNISKIIEKNIENKS